MSSRPDSLTERDLTRQVRELASLFGWRRYHTWLAVHSTAGFPDEVLLRPPRLIMAELKSDKGKLSPAQTEWLDDLLTIPTIEVCLWRPSMIDAIALYLQARERPDIGPGRWQPSGQAHAMRASNKGAWDEA